MHRVPLDYAGGSVPFRFLSSVFASSDHHPTSSITLSTSGHILVASIWHIFEVDRGTKAGMIFSGFCSQPAATAVVPPIAMNLKRLRRLRPFSFINSEGSIVAGVAIKQIWVVIVLFVHQVRLGFSSGIVFFGIVPSCHRAHSALTLNGPFHL